MIDLVRDWFIFLGFIWLWEVLFFLFILEKLCYIWCFMFLIVFFSSSLCLILELILFYIILF